MKVKNYGIKLVTGIPRSGTTLCCKLLNQCDNTLALHEPIDPQKLSSLSAVLAVDEIQEQIHSIRSSLEQNKAIEHGDSKGIELDNPVGQVKDSHGLRVQESARGKVSLPSINNDTVLYIKQNALFTALAHELTKYFTLVAIMRNPVDVLLSWMTVKLPVNQGRLPAGEKYDSNLAILLQQGSVFERQIAIYRWFIQKFEAANLNIVRYEDIISTNGVALFSAFGIQNQVPLNHVTREFPKDTVDCLHRNWAALEALGNEAGYSSVFLKERLNSLRVAQG